MVLSSERIFVIFDMVPTSEIFYTVFPQVFAYNITYTVTIMITLQEEDIIFCIKNLKIYQQMPKCIGRSF